MVSLDNATNLNDISIWLRKAVKTSKSAVMVKSRRIDIPVLYGGEFGPDLDRVGQYTGLDPNEVIKRHYEAEYLVYFIGFSVGFPYFGGMDESIAAPRLDSPRKSVPAGSVGIAGTQTGVYPLSSPGGWNLIGRTPHDLFDVNHPEKSFVQMGDRVRFVSIDLSTFDQLKK